VRKGLLRYVTNLDSSQSGSGAGGGGLWRVLMLLAIKPMERGGSWVRRTQWGG